MPRHTRTLTPILGNQLAVHARAPRARGFTLLEVVLAGVLGSILIIAAIGLTAALERSQRRHAGRLTFTMGKANAHEALSKTFNALIMTSEAEPTDDELKERQAAQRERSAVTAEAFDPAAATVRFSMHASPVGGRLESGSAQQIALTLRSSPFAGGQVDPTDRELELIDAGLLEPRSGAGASASEIRRAAAGRSGQPEWMIRAAQQRSVARQSARQSRERAAPVADKLAEINKNAEDSADGNAEPTADAGDKLTGGKGDGDRSEAAARSDAQAAASTGRSASDAGASAGESGAAGAAGVEYGTEPGRAPGVRGVFEILPDDQERAGGIRGMDDGRDASRPPTFALWYRELPPILEADGPSVATRPGSPARAARGVSADEREELIEAALRSPTLATKRVKLMGDLVDAQFRAMRVDGRQVATSAKWAAELPAYVEFSFQAITGERENWVFELAWSNGPDPGTVVARSGSAGGGQSDALQDALDLANRAATGNPQSTSTPRNSAGGGNASAGGKGPPTTTGLDQSVQDAINRAVQQGNNRNQPSSPK
jgi:Tfp pilus assembly protein PilE